MSQTLQTYLKIHAGVDGLSEFAQLSKQLDSLGVDTSELHQEFDQLSSAFQQVKTKQGLIDHFKRLKISANEAKEQLEQSQQSTNALAHQWKTAERDAKALADAIKVQSTATQEQKEQFKQAKQNAKQLNQQFKSSLAKTQKLRANYKQLNRHLHNTRKSLSDAGISIKNLTAHQKQLNLQTEQVQQGLLQLNDRMRQLSTETHQLQQRNQQTQQSIEQLKSGFLKAKTSVLALISAMSSIGIGASAILKTADEYTNLVAKVKIATQETGNFTQAMAGIHQVALATNRNLESIAGLFARLNQVGKDSAVYSGNARWCIAWRRV